MYEGGKGVILGEFDLFSYTPGKEESRGGGEGRRIDGWMDEWTIGHGPMLYESNHNHTERPAGRPVDRATAATTTVTHHVPT